MGPAGTSGLIAGHLGVFRQEARPGQLDADRSGQPGPGGVHRGSATKATKFARRHKQAATGISDKRLVRGLKPLQEVTASISGHRVTAQPQLTAAAQRILNSLSPGH